MGNVLELALLEALNKARRQIIHLNVSPHACINEAIAALEEAIKTQGDQAPFAWTIPNAKTVHDFSFYQTRTYTEPLYTSAPTIPAGWKLVKIDKVTQEMVDAGRNTPVADTDDDEADAPQDYINMFNAMLAASPEFKGETE